MSKIIDKLKGIEDTKGINEEDLEHIEIIEEPKKSAKKAYLKVLILLIFFMGAVYLGYLAAGYFFSSVKIEKVPVSKESAQTNISPTKSPGAVEKERTPVLFTGSKKFEKNLLKKANEDILDPVSLNNLAVFYFEKMDYERALKMAQKALLSEPENPYFWNTLGIILTEMNLYQDAEKCFKKSIEKAPDIGVFYYNLANLYERMNNITDSKEKYLLYLSKSDTINPKMIDYVREKLKKGF